MENPINMDDLGVDPFLETTPNGYFAQLDKQNCAFMNTFKLNKQNVDVTIQPNRSVTIMLEFSRRINQ